MRRTATRTMANLIEMQLSLREYRSFKEASSEGEKAKKYTKKKSVIDKHKIKEEKKKTVSVPL